MITFLRRKKLGAGSVRGIGHWLSSMDTGRASSVGVRCWTDATGAISVLRNEELGGIASTRILEATQLLVRWGCATPTGIGIEKQVNPSHAIRSVNDKLGARQRLSLQEPELVPETLWSVRDYEDTLLNGAPSMILRTSTTNITSTTMILRPKHHAQGRNLHVVEDMDTLRRLATRYGEGNWYASELIDKVREVRVYWVSGRVATVAEKTPADPSAVAWNVAQGGRFDVIGWGDWPLEACRVACEAMKHFELDFGGVDLMMDRDGRWYLIEINSAPSLPLLSDGSVSYRQKCMAKTFKWMLEHGKERMDADYNNGWRGYIHPAIQEYD
jgi:hypothetical protein